MLDHLKLDIDYGTPKRESVKEVTLEIDGQQVTVPEGTSVHARRRGGRHHDPKLCATDSLEPFGSCRLCLVEIEGRRAIPQAAPRRPKPA
jgi:formate dehydrogenase major subunit